MSERPPTAPAPGQKQSDGAAPDEHAMEVRLAKLLTLGTTVSAAVVLIGVSLYLWKHSGDTLDFRTFQDHPDELNAPATIVSRAWAFDAQAIMQFGVLLLVLTPIARVAFTLLSFVVRRDWMYVVISAIVLGVLCLGLLGIRVH